MSYKNSLKLFVSNFALVWKQLLYSLIIVIICGLFTYLASTPIINLLNSNGIFDKISNLLQTVYTAPSEVVVTFNETMSTLGSVLSSSFGSLWGSYLGLILLGIILPNILIQMSFYNLASITYQKITMNMNVKYIQNGIQNLIPSIKYALSNILFTLPFTILQFAFIIVFINTAKTVISSLLGLIILSALLLILGSFKLAIFTGIAPNMIASNMNPFTAFGKSFVSTIKHFWLIFSMSLAVRLTIIFVNGIIALFTFFSGLAITIPSTYLFIAIFYVVTYLTSKGERYYLDDNYIYNPVKYVIKQEDYTQMNIPEIREVKITTTPIKRSGRKPKNND
ncbi:MAG: hypothetical protein IJ538_02145 [Clostridia bacterium]|nr:hypothetical protein [Clostridia bacterium]